MSSLQNKENNGINRIWDLMFGVPPDKYNTIPVKLFGKHKFDFGMSNPIVGDQMIIRSNWEENKEGKI